MGLFREPIHLAWGALAVAGAVVLWLWTEKRRQAALLAFARAAMLPRLFPAGAVRIRRIRHALSAGALAALFVALAGPQWGVEMVTTQSKSTQVVIAVDTSLSMLAEDLKPNRMLRAKGMLKLLIDGLRGERVGLIAFAGEAFIQCPLTMDTLAVKSILQRTETGMVPQPGTALGKAIRLGSKLLGRYSGHKALVLLTDGEDHKSDPLKAAKEAAENGIHLFVLGVGTPEGDPIPMKDPAGRVTGYKKDPRGETVISRLGEKSLIELAAASKGAYYRVSDSGAEVSSILKRISEMDKTDLRSSSANRYRNRYRFPLLAALLLLLIELMLPEAWTPGPRPERRPASPRGGRAISRAGAALVLLIPWSLSGCGAGDDFSLWRANSKYKKEDFGEALKRYEKGGEDAKSRFNAGAATYKLGDYEGAEKAFQDLAESADQPELKTGSRSSTNREPRKSDAYYNLGNALFQSKKHAEAAEAYKRCLLLDPKDEDCRHNLVLALRPPKKCDDKSKSKKDKKDKKKDQEKPSPPRQQPPSTRRRKQGLSKEDAERILRAVREKERQAQKRLQKKMRQEQRPSGKPGVDW